MNERIAPALLEKFPLLVRQGLAKLAPADQQAFLEEYRRREKSTRVGLLLCFLLGCHYIYLREWGSQFLFWLTGGGLLIWWLVDLFRVSGMVRDYNNDVAVDVYLNLKAIEEK
jgi:hypothetical protein